MKYIYYNILNVESSIQLFKYGLKPLDINNNMLAYMIIIIC